MSFAQKKLVSLFKNFVEKVFVPHLPKIDPSCHQEWNKFSSMISSDHFNVGELQLYVDSIQTSSLSIPQGFDKVRNKSPLLVNKVRKENNGDGQAFNPSRTFGGDKAKIMFPLKDYEETGDKLNPNYSKDLSKGEQDKPNLTAQTLLPTLQKLFKSFSENHAKIERGPGVTMGPYERKPY